MRESLGKAGYRHRDSHPEAATSMEIISYAKRKAHSVHLRTSKGKHPLSLHMYIEDRNIYVGREAVVIMDIPYYHLCSTARGEHLEIEPLVRGAILNFVFIHKPRIVWVVGFSFKDAERIPHRESSSCQYSLHVFPRGTKWDCKITHPDHANSTRKSAEREWNNAQIFALTVSVKRLSSPQVVSILPTLLHILPLISNTYLSIYAIISVHFTSPPSHNVTH
ncbi:hypothetical protein BGZ60DRAFT_214265 [Tricladium varicosporioides]|nr:hypothetical protein BGZ60DRAFT_214265 [Hymenoscyphus varicosporioides]